jgi:hypothetical protein
MMNKRAGRKWLAGIAAAVGVIVIVYFSGRYFLRDNRPALSGPQVVGAWSGSNGFEFDFEQVGSFRAANLPEDILDMGSYGICSMATGSWQLAADVNDRTGRLTEVEIRFTDLTIELGTPFTMDLHSRFDGNRLILYAYKGGDSASTYDLHKNRASP